MTYTFTFPSGMHFLHIYNDSPVSHFGILINTGTRDEKDNENGCAHLVEHTIFKGTTKRSAKTISMALDHIGADVNAYTTKEDTCIHVSFLSEYYSKIMDVFSDMLFHSVFPDDGVEKEINVIKEEIMSCNDDPSDVIFDDFEDALFAGHSMGRNILGTPYSLDTFVKNIDILKSFFNNNYLNDEIVVWSNGRLSNDKFHKLCERFFGVSPLLSGKHDRIAVPQYNKFEKFIERDDSQCNVILGGRAFSCYEEERVAFTLLNHYLGNYGMSSRLNYAVREKRGLVYQIESGYNPYYDTGAFSVFYECDYQKHNEVNELIFKELNRCCNDRMKTLQLDVAKKQLKGSLAVASDSRLNDTISSAKSLLVYNKVDSLDDVFKKIDGVSADNILDVANVIFNNNNISQLIYIPNYSE